MTRLALKVNLHPPLQWRLADSKEERSGTHCGCMSSAARENPLPHSADDTSGDSFCHGMLPRKKPRIYKWRNQNDQKDSWSQQVRRGGKRAPSGTSLYSISQVRTM